MRPATASSSFDPSVNEPSNWECKSFQHKEKPDAYLGVVSGKWREKRPESWERDTARFFAGLEALDQRLASGAPLGWPAEKVFQGPIADALTHTGQIAMLRRMAGAPVRGENYFKAEIVAGRVGADQAPPRLEFD